MLYKLKELEGLVIHATDGDIGLTIDFYFDDDWWAVRYLLVETGPWFSSKIVLLSPMAIKHLNIAEKAIAVAITREQVTHSPNIDTQKPVSRQFEVDYSGYYAYPFYWSGRGLWGSYTSPHMVAPGYESDVPETTPDDDSNHRKPDHHLRSGNEVVGYHIQAKDGEIGHLEGMLIDTETLAIRYLILNTSNWWLGHSVLVAPQWIEKVSWTHAKIYVDMTQQQIKDAPRFDPDVPFTRKMEQAIYLHYHRKGYWEDALIRD